MRRLRVSRLYENLPLVCELHGVLHQVDEHLFKTSLVSNERWHELLGPVFVTLRAQPFILNDGSDLNLLGFHLGDEDLTHVLDDVYCAERLVLEVDRPKL